MAQPLDMPQGPAFKEIVYSNQQEINYLDDMGKMGPNYISFLESLNHNQIEENNQLSSYYDNVADDLYKKIVKQGYIERPSRISRKNKKGDSDINYYNSSDVFINDDECCVEKKDKFSTFEDYSGVGINSIEELYASPAYSRKVEELIVEVGKRKVPEQFSLTEEHQIEKFDEIKKNIRDSILNRNRGFLEESENKGKKDDLEEDKEGGEKDKEGKDKKDKEDQKPGEVSPPRNDHDQPQIIITPPPEMPNSQQNA